MLGNTLRKVDFVVGAILSLVSFLEARNLDYQPPVTKIYQVDDSNNILRLWDKTDVSTSESIIENVENLRLECSANYPVQFIYTGNGIPLLSENISTSANQRRSEELSEFTASVFLSPLKEHHTGKYQCSHTDYLSLSPFIYIYVPGQQLFSSLKGKSIYIPKNDSTILIPCSVSHPKVQVTLEKSDGEVLKKLIAKASDAISFDPREGFRVNTRKIEDPEGVYVCTARYKHLVRGVEYSVKSSETSYEELQQNPPETCNEESCERKCETHTDCPSTMSCYTDRVCRNPCVHSIRCGTGASCRVVKQRPECYCPPDWIGDATKQCFNTLQGSPAVSTPGTDSKNDGPSCKKDDDCAKELQCYRSSTNSQSQCRNPCQFKSCARNAKCIAENHSANCYCLRGFFGDAESKCGPIKLEVEMIAPTESVVSKNEAGSLNLKSCRRSQDCAGNADCKDRRCQCKTGYTGSYPNCVEAEMDLGEISCENNRDCANNQVCHRFGQSENSTCADVCGSRICGHAAICHEGTTAIPSFCLCQAGFSGDPYSRCEDVSSKLGKDCQIDAQCGKNLRCETGASFRKCSDPCARRTCPENQQCKVETHIARCVCSPGFTGNSQIGCNKDLEVTPEKLVNLGCASLKCGQNSECRIVNGNPTCECQSGYVGLPPFCRAECKTNSNCSSEQVCILKRCRNGCSNKCGKNAKCRLASTPERTPICSCPDGYSGDANVECKKNP